MVSNALMSGLTGKPNFLSVGSASVWEAEGDAVDAPDRVGEQAELAPAALARVEQLERAGGEVARVGVGLLAARAVVVVEAGEVGLAHVDLAARLEQCGGGVGRPGAAGRRRWCWRLCVTSSPLSPSPRVAPTSRTPLM